MLEASKDRSQPVLPQTHLARRAPEKTANSRGPQAGLASIGASSRNRAQSRAGEPGVPRVL